MRDEPFSFGSWSGPYVRPQTMTPSWQTEVPEEKRDGDFVIRTTGKRSETILDLTRKPMPSSQSLRPERDTDKTRRMLEEEKRRLAGGNRGGFDKEGSAEAMRGVQKKLKELLKRQRSVRL